MSPSPPPRKKREKEREREKRRKRPKERDESKDRERRHHSREERERSREKERPRRSRSRSFSRDRDRERSYERAGPSSSRRDDRPRVSEADLEGKSPEEQDMMRMMGFCGFDTTKGKKVDGNDVGGVHVILKRKYRQYMNRKGGFNRPLDFVA